jgi:hypothetical protein
MNPHVEPPMKRIVIRVNGSTPNTPGSRPEVPTEESPMSHGLGVSKV